MNAPKMTSMKNSMFVWLLLCTLAVISGCRAPSPDWNGTWELNSSKSRFQGSIITVLLSTDGEYRYDDGNVNDTFRCDGKYRSIGQNRTQACVKSSATTLDKTRMEKGVKTTTYHWELSDGGKIFTSTVTALRPSGPVIIGQLVLSRMSGSYDFVGQWRDTRFLQWDAQLTLRLDSQYLHIGYPSAGQYVDAPLSGADSVVYGRDASKRVTFAVRRTGQREFFILGKNSGKPFRRQTLELSADGRVVTVSWLDSDEQSAKTTLVFEKQNAGTR